MEHSNPILMGNDSPQKFITIGEVMLRLTPPNYEKIRMASSFEASYGGSEANIALALANLGVDSTFFSVVPNNSLGKSAVRWLRCNDVHCTPMILSTKEETPSHRLGTYYLETGYGIRPSKVIYDRKHSAMAEYDFSDVDLGALLEGFDWLHLSGITPALSPNCSKLVLDMLRVAKEKGLTVSFDGNFRSMLWSWEEARDFCTQCLPYVDILLGIEPYHLWRDEDDHSRGDVKDGVPMQPSYEQQDEIFQRAETLAEIGDEFGAFNTLVLSHPDDKRAVWAARSAFLTVIEADTEHLDEMDVVVPVDKVAEFLEHVHQIGEKYGVGIRSFGHAGDGNLHIYASANGVDQDVFLEKSQKVMKESYEKCTELNGQVSGEHGIGHAKKEYLHDSIGDTAIGLMAGIKRVFDPNYILNPGKVCN